MNTARRGIDQSSEKLSPRRLDNRGPGTDRRRSFRRSNPCRRFRMLIAMERAVPAGKVIRTRRARRVNYQGEIAVHYLLTEMQKSIAQSSSSPRL
jgi:hypothetical protein